MVKKIASLSLICVLLGGSTFSAGGQATAPFIEAQDPRAEQPFKLCWDYKFDPAPFRSLATAQNNVFIAEAGGRVRAISSSSNQTLWMSELGGSIVSMFIGPRSTLYVVNLTSPKVGTSKTTLRNLDPETGLVRFSVDLAENGGDYLGVSASRLIVSDKEGNILGLDPTSGSTIWNTKTNSRIVTKPAYGEATVAFASKEKKIEFLNVMDGKFSTPIITSRQVTSLAFRANQMIIAGDDRGNVTNFRDQSGNIWWQFKSGGQVGAITETDEGILVGSYDNFLYMISKYSGDVKWKRRLDGRIVQQPSVRKKEIISTILAESETVVLDSDNGKILEHISLGDRSFPVADPIYTEGSMLVVPVSTGFLAFSRTGCK